MIRERKRFIAGAVCPRCAEQDRIRTFEEDGVQHRECVACGFTDAVGADAGEVLPRGRLDAPARPPRGRAQPIRFHPPRSSERSSGRGRPGGRPAGERSRDDEHPTDDDDR